MPEQVNVSEFVHIEPNVETNVICYSFFGKMDTVNSSSLTGFISDSISGFLKNGFEKHRLKVVFDLDKVTFVSSFFLRVCFVVLKSIEKGNFSIINASQQVNNILKMSGLEKVTNILNKDDEVKIFQPFPDFAIKAKLNDPEKFMLQYSDSIENTDTYWKEQALSNIEWIVPFDETLRWDLPNAKWFVNGKLNVSANCLDKHLKTSIADKPAIIWEGEPVTNDKPIEKYTITYRQLYSKVCIFANVLKELGIKKGDRVIIYLPMIPESVVSMLACARIGAIHSVIFAGFSAQAIAERAEDCQAKLIITADESYRRGKLIPLKENVDKAIEILNTKENSVSLVEKVLVFEHTGNPTAKYPERDYFYSELCKNITEYCEPEKMDSEDVLFILYTSGSTGKPKGIFHTSAGYLLGANLTFAGIMDIKHDDIFWCTADIGWITGHSYVVYGPLSNGATVYMYEGAPDYPNYDRFWKIIEENKITIFYTAPTAIRAFMKWGEKWLESHNLSSLRLLGTVGEPINPEAWQWYFENVGKSKCPIVDTWWQTETGSIMLSPLPGATALKPGSVGIPFLGIDADVIDDDGKPVPANQIGNLVIKKPWPSMARGIWASSERFKQVYWSDFPGYYFTGDCARRDNDGFFWIVGRADDVIVVSGHNIGTAEVESALVAHHSIAEAAVVGKPDDFKTTVIVAFVTVKSGIIATDALKDELRQKVAESLGHLAKPDEIRFAEALPKTRSGKIMRRLLRQIAAGTDLSGDVTTLEDFAVLDKLKAKIKI